MGFVGRKPTNAPLTADDIPNGIIGAADLASGISGLITWQSVQTTGFTAVAGRGYPCNTTSAAFTVTLPATPSVGDTIILLDYAGTFDTNAITINPNGNKIEGSTDNVLLSGEREGATLTYIDSTQGWLASSGINEGTDALSPTSYSVDFLVIAGGGGGGNEADSYGSGGGGAGGYRNSYLTETSGGGGSSEASLTFNIGTVYTITVGAGGAVSSNGVDSSISGTGLTTITSTGGGGGKGNANGNSGGSGGGGGEDSRTGGSGTANQGFAGGNGTAGSPFTGGGGGDASAVGVTSNGSTRASGGAGLASSITGSSVSRGGGGGASSTSSSLNGNGGTGGGGAGTVSGSNNAVAGTANTGGGGGGGFGNAPAPAKAGGKGVVILRIPTASYSGTTTGSPTVTTDGSDKVIVFNDSGSITG